MKVHIIDLEFQNLEAVIAAFLVETEYGLILIEPGPGSTNDTLLEKMRSLGFSPEMVEAVFVTHAHLDHAGAAGWWAALGVDLYVHEKAARHLIDPSRLVESARTVFGEKFDALWGEMLPAPEQHVNVMKDGETIEIGGVKIEAINTPGHAFHHHAFAIDNTCFAGDVAGARLEGSGYTSVTSAPPQFHLDSYLESIDRLAERNFSKLYLTHFGEVVEVASHLANYRAAVIGAAEIVKSMLDDGGDIDSIRVGYEAFQLEQAFKAKLPREMWDRYQASNNTDMCADGIRLFWERETS